MPYPPATLTGAGWIVDPIINPQSNAVSPGLQKSLGAEGWTVQPLISPYDGQASTGYTKNLTGAGWVVDPIPPKPMGAVSLASQVAAMFAAMSGPAKLQLRPSVESSVFADFGGTTPITAGTGAGRILDLSGAANHLGQVSATSRPLWQQGGGLTWLQADGLDDSLYSLANFNASGLTKLTVIAGLRKRSNAGRAQFLELGASGAMAGAFGMTVPEDATGALSVARNGGLGNGAVNSSARGAPLSLVETVGYDLTGTTHATQIPIFRINGVAANATDAGVTNTGPGPFASAILNLFRRDNSTFPAAVDLFTLMIVSGIPDLSTLSIFERFAAQESGVTL